MVRRYMKRRILALAISITLVFLTFFVLVPPAMSVEVNPGSPSSSSLFVGNTITFSNVRLTIRNTERIDVGYLKFSIYNSNDQDVAYVSFNIFGDEIAESPVGAFTVTNLTDVKSYYTTVGTSYGYDERTGENFTNYDYGYGYAFDDLNILYTITFVTQSTGSFYSKLLVNSSLHNFVSTSSSSFNVRVSGGGGGGGVPPPPSNIQPTADANGPYAGMVDEQIEFDGSDSTDSDGTITSYSWDFGDGNSATGVSPTHTYTTAGTYTVTLTVTDNGGLTDTDTTTATISEEGAPQPPVADPGGPYTGLTYQSITFDGSNSIDPDGTISNFVWSFGDGELGLGEKPLHSYSSAGEFTITLTVTDNDGQIDTETTTATIQLDTDADGWSDEQEESYNTNISDPNDLPTDSDGDGIPDEASDDGKYPGDTDDDNDGIDDETENVIGSDSKNANDSKEFQINGDPYYLIDIDGEGTFDKFYDPVSKILTETKLENGKYLINIDEDPEWEYIFDPAQATTIEYQPKEQEPPEEFDWIIISIISVIAVVIIIIAALFKTGYLYIEEEPIEKIMKKYEDMEDIEKKKESTKKKGETKKKEPAEKKTPAKKSTKKNTTKKK